jgi:Sulfotransferase family
MASLISRLKGLVPGPAEVGPDDPRHPRHALTETGIHSAELFTTRRYPIYYLSITKCGCTYLQNLFYHLDHDALHHDPTNIHDYRGDMVRATDVSDEEILASDYGFVVVRDPVERFMSVYFDKVWDDASEDFPQLRQILKEDEGIVTGPSVTLEQHRENCAKFVEWVDRNLAKQTDFPPNPHWVRQGWRQRYARMFRLHGLTLDGLDWQLPRFLEGAVPDIAEHMKAVTVRNTTFRPFATEEILTPDLRAGINRLYAVDRKTYDRIASAWKQIGDGVEGAKVPRFEPKKK